MKNKQEWRSESADEKAEYEAWKTKRRKRVPHQFNWKILSWMACSQCGLLRFRNAATKAAISAGCEE